MYICQVILQKKDTKIVLFVLSRPYGLFVNVPRLQRRELPASTRTALQLRGTAAAYTLSTGVDSRATHGTLCVMSGRYSPSFFSYIYRSVLISVMVTATFRTIPFPYRYVLGCIVLEATNMT